MAARLGEMASRVNEIRAARKRKKRKKGALLTLTLGLAVVIRSAFARGYGATGETLNRYIGGGRKRGPTTDMRGVENSDAGEFQ